jgi:glycerate kinase
MLAFFGATLNRGAQIVIEATRLRERLPGADLCITGEGRIDQQTLSGKTVIDVARLCREMNVRCVAIAGRIDADIGISSYPLPIDDDFAHAVDHVERVSEEVVRSQLRVLR